jgi:hypothetical protein
MSLLHRKPGNQQPLNSRHQNDLKVARIPVLCCAWKEGGGGDPEAPPVPS